MRLADAPGLADLIENGDPDEVAVILAGLEQEAAESDPETWLRTMFPTYVSHPFAEHQRALLDWVWSIELGVRVRAFLAVWARGGAKSTLAELVAAIVGALRTRRYALYVCETQEQANQHVQNIATMLESPTIGHYYPALAARAVSKYGHSRGWKRDRLRTASGLTVDALGLDTAARGVKMDEQRPDLIVVDDVDDPFDNPGTVRKKLDTLTRSLLQAGSEDLAVLVIQNLIHSNGVVAQILDGRAEALADRITSGPIPAIAGAYAIEETGDTRSWEEGGQPWRIVGGEPTWEGQDRDACEAQLARVGPTAWESEAQHKPRRLVGGMFEDVLDGVAHCLREEVPDLVKKSIAVDPAVTDTDASDAHGVQCDGLGVDDAIYRLRSWEQRATPGHALEVAITWAYEEGVAEVGVEMNTGSDLSGRGVEESWRVAFDGAVDRVLDDHPEWRERPRPKVKKLRATASTGSKAARGSVMHADYERPGRVCHVIGDHATLEAALGRAFVVKPFDLADAAYYSWADLRGRIPVPAETAAAQIIAARIPVR